MKYKVFAKATYWEMEVECVFFSKETLEKWNNITPFLEEVKDKCFWFLFMSDLSDKEPTEKQDFKKDMKKNMQIEIKKIEEVE